MASTPRPSSPSLIALLWALALGAVALAVLGARNVREPRGELADGSLATATSSAPELLEAQRMRVEAALDMLLQLPPLARSTGELDRILGSSRVLPPRGPMEHPAHAHTLERPLPPPYPDPQLDLAGLHV